jgi:hypothetical protein
MARPKGTRNGHLACRLCSQSNDLGSLRAGHPNEHYAMRCNQSLKMLREYTHIFWRHKSRTVSRSVICSLPVTPTQIRGSSNPASRVTNRATPKGSRWSVPTTHLINVVSRCSHGALSPCCEGHDAPTERGGYSANVYEMAYKQQQKRPSQLGSAAQTLTVCL